MGGADQGVPEPSRRHECCRLVCRPRHYESKLLLQTAPRKGSVSGIPCSRGSDAADCPGKHLSATAGNTKRQRYTAGAFHLCKQFFHPRNGIHTHVAACGSPGGGAECSMTQPALKPSTLSAATPTCALGWTGWRHSWKLRPGTGHMSRIPSIFSAGGAQTASRDLYGKGTAGSCYTSGFRKAASSGRAPQRMYVN